MVPEEIIARQELERVWDLKLREARARFFRSAAEFHRRVLADTTTGYLEPPDSDEIRRSEALAFAEYCRVLAAFTELRASGKLPAQPSRT